MSRLFVKDLPKGITDTKLKELFSEKGIVTDVQLKYTKDGKFRRFGFVGFKTEEQAKVALEFFNKSYIDTTRITVELCAGLADPSKPRSWSKYAADSAIHKKLQESTDKPKEITEKSSKQSKNKENDQIKSLLEKHKDDPLFEEFLETHGVDKKPRIVEETEKSASESEEEDEASEEEIEDEKMAEKKVSDMEYMEALKKKSQDLEKTTKNTEDTKPHGPTKFFTVKLKGLGYNHKKKHIKQFFHPLKAKSIRVPQKIKGIAYVGFKSEKQRNQALNKDKSFLEGKRIFVSKYDEDKHQTEVNDTPPPRWKNQEESLKDEEEIAESGRMFVRNLAYTTTEDDIKVLFEKYGPVTEVNLPVDRDTRKLKGFGTITFLMPEHAARAYSELDGSIFNGRMLHLLPGKARTSVNDLLQKDGLSYKEKKELERKSMSNSSHNWNTLFLGQNTVVDAIASAYNTTKEKVITVINKTFFFFQ